MNTTIDIAKERATAQARLTELKQQRGAALLDGKTINHDEIVNLENTLNQLADAEGEFTRRERAEAEAARQARLAELRKALGRMEKRRLEAVRDAETGARDLVEAQDRCLKVTAEMATTCHQITGGSPPIPLQGSETVGRLAARLISVMRTIPNHRHRFGPLGWQGSWHSEEDWLAAETKLLEPNLKTLTQEGK